MLKTLVLVGIASFYAPHFNGRQTSSGEIFSNRFLTAAHKTLPFGTMVKVTNLSNNKSVLVRINDRGPFCRGRIIDLSSSAFNSIGSTRTGLLKVKIEVVNAKSKSAKSRKSERGN